MASEKLVLCPHHRLDCLLRHVRETLIQPVNNLRNCNSLVFGSRCYSFYLIPQHVDSAAELGVFSGADLLLVCVLWPESSSGE